MSSNDDLLLQELTRDEGFKSSAYTDSLGYWTIGIGRMIDARRGGGITLDEAQDLLCNDVAKVAVQLDKALPWWRNLDPVRQRVVANMTFNMGIDDFLKFKNTIEFIKNGKYEDAGNGMASSLWAKQVGDRADRLIKMMKEGTT